MFGTHLAVSAIESAIGEVMVTVGTTETPPLILLLEINVPPNNPLKKFVARSYIAPDKSTIVFTPVEIIVHASVPPSVMKFLVVLALEVKIL